MSLQIILQIVGYALCLRCLTKRHCVSKVQKCQIWTTFASARKFCGPHRNESKKDWIMLQKICRFWHRKVELKMNREGEVECLKKLIWKCLNLYAWLCICGRKMVISCRFFNYVKSRWEWGLNSSERIINEPSKEPATKGPFKNCVTQKSIFLPPLPYITRVYLLFYHTLPLSHLKNDKLWWWYMS